MEDLFSIGELSRYQHISKQTLIFYDRTGLFRPAYVDPHNGYRYYSAAQLDYLDTILILKKIGFSLSEIKAHMRRYDLQKSLALFKSQLPVIDRQIGELKLIRSRIVNRCEQMEAAAARRREGETVTVEPLPEQYLLTQPVDPPYTLRETSIATKRCFTEGFGRGLPVFFQCGVIVPLAKVRAGKYTEASHAFLPAEKAEAADIRYLPAGKAAVTYHIGDYLSIGRSYERVLRYCAENGLEILSDSYEFCINDYITTRDEDEYITKICFYVRKKG